MTKYEVISTEYVTVEVREDGKEIVIKLADGVKISRHQNQLRAYVEKLHKQGVKRINADQITLPYLDKSIKLTRGNNRLDLVYYTQGRIYECEFKTRRECGLDKTYHQVKDQVKHCQNFILLVPQSELTFVTDEIRNRRIQGITIDAWDK
jgi:hypothetical protein